MAVCHSYTFRYAPHTRRIRHRAMGTKRDYTRTHAQQQRTSHVAHTHAPPKCGVSPNSAAVVGAGSASQPCVRACTSRAAVCTYIYSLMDMSFLEAQRSPQPALCDTHAQQMHAFTYVVCVRLCVCVCRLCDTLCKYQRINDEYSHCCGFRVSIIPPSCFCCRANAAITVH